MTAVANDPHEWLTTGEFHVMIIDGIRRDGSRFTTSVSDTESLQTSRQRLGLVGGRVSRWVRDGNSRLIDVDAHVRLTTRDWRLAERFAL